LTAHKIARPAALHELVEDAHHSRTICRSIVESGNVRNSLASQCRLDVAGVRDGATERRHELIGVDTDHQGPYRPALRRTKRRHLRRGVRGEHQAGDRDRSEDRGT